jgi:hypothetical protein
VREYYLSVIETASLADLRSRHYESYASRQAGTGTVEAAALVYRRDIRALLSPPGAAAVADIDCGCDPVQLDGHIRARDLTHHTSSTARSIRKLAAVAGFHPVLARSSPPVVHGLASVAHAAETGMQCGHIVTLNLAFAACKGADLVNSAERSTA